MLIERKRRSVEAPSIVRPTLSEFLPKRAYYSKSSWQHDMMPTNGSNKQTHRHTDRQTDTHTGATENITSSANVGGKNRVRENFLPLVGHFV